MTAPIHRPDCPGEANGCTLDGHEDDASICRTRGWKAGTVLEGNGHCMVITGIGRTLILGCDVGDERGDTEILWSLDGRCWGVPVDDEVSSQAARKDAAQ